MLSGKHGGELWYMDVDRYQLSFIGRTWRVEWRYGERLLGVIPVTGDEDRVWYHEKHWDEMEALLADRWPFVVAMSEQEGRTFKRFRDIYEVVATGGRASDRGIETRIVRRIRGRLIIETLPTAGS
jgi:hypothetical protein